MSEVEKIGKLLENLGYSFSKREVSTYGGNYIYYKKNNLESELLVNDGNSVMYVRIKNTDKKEVIFIGNTKKFIQYYREQILQQLI
jgi:hypothetical protein